MAALDVKQLAGSLKTLAAGSAGLKPLYVLHGEEELLRIEALDQLRAAARERGYFRQMQVVEGSALDWQALQLEVNSAALFGDLKCLEIHCPSGKLGKQGGDFLQQLAENPPPGTCIIIVLPKLDKTQLQSKWFHSLAKSAMVVEAKAVTPAMLPAWVRERLQAAHLTIEADALALLVERMEGNLLAAKQEIDKLALLYTPPYCLTLADIEQAVANVARFDVFQLSGAWMGGDVKRVLRLLDGLQAEGQDPVLLLWAVAEDIRILIRLAAALKQGKTVSAMRQTLRLWGDKQNLAQCAVQRLSGTRLMTALQTCAQIDRQIKGAADGEAWSSLKQLLMDLAV